MASSYASTSTEVNRFRPVIAPHRRFARCRHFSQHYGDACYASIPERPSHAPWRITLDASPSLLLADNSKVDFAPTYEQIATEYPQVIFLTINANRHPEIVNELVM